MSHSQRVMCELRTCRDCGTGYRYAEFEAHHNSRYCPGCLPAHPRTCRVCKSRLHPEGDTDRHCPVCVTHPALF